MGLDFHEHFGDQKCPVCGHGTLDETWAVAARAALEQDQEAAQALKAARAATAQARSAVMAAVRDVQAPPPADSDLTTLDAARKAYDAFVKLPADGDDRTRGSRDGHARTSAGGLRTPSAGSRAARFKPALTLGDRSHWNWRNGCVKAERVAEAAPKLAVADEALKWLQKNAGVLRNERIAPLADQAKRIWAALRQESNVDLGEIRLEGQKTTRRVVLKADVDGSDTDAFGVMSQGELQALSLAIFIPRATSPSSPFRFLVLDDPIQAMDPSKIDGFLEVLVGLAETRQVIVFTHDDRLPSAIRMSRAPARIVELSRGANSVVTVTESTRPADRLLDDAYAIAADKAVPDDIKKKAIPVLCREALEATAWDVYSSRQLTAGRSRAELEDTWENATTTRLRVALAVDPSDDTRDREVAGRRYRASRRNGRGHQRCPHWGAGLRGGGQAGPLGRQGSADRSRHDRTAPTLLDYADQLLDGEFGLGARGPRTAALLARTVLEEWLDEQSASWSSPTLGFPTARSKIVALGAVRGASVGERTRRVWHALSRAVHHHAYELQPSAAEIRQLVGAVRELQEQ